MYKENEICLGIWVIQDGFPEEVAFKCWEQREEMRRMLAEVHKFISYPWPCSILGAKSGFEPSFPVVPSWSSALSLNIVSSLTHRYTNLHIQTLKGYILCSFLACRCFLQGKQWLLMPFLVRVMLRSLYRSNVAFGGSLATCLFLSVSESISLRATGASCQPEINWGFPQDKCV